MYSPKSMLSIVVYEDTLPTQEEKKEIYDPHLRKKLKDTRTTPTFTCSSSPCSVL